MNAKVIIGANLGDEGKGTVVARCVKDCKGKVLNILTNGGAQRAHSILTESGSFTFQHFGSGTYHGADNYFSEYYILNPMQFVKECTDLLSRNVKIGKVYRNIGCRWSTPYDMMANQIIEQLRGENHHGTCGMGIWETVLRYMKTKTVTLDEFIRMSFEHQMAYLRTVKGYFETQRLEVPDSWKSVWNNDMIALHFINDCKFLKDFTEVFNSSELNGYESLVFENGQGLMLNDTGKDIQGTTPSRTDSTYAMEIAKSFGVSDIELHYVTRPYLTRHGKGDLDKECQRGVIASSIEEDRTNHYNQFQEDFRYAPLDLSALRDRIQKDSVGQYKTVLEVTHCDEMDREKEFRQMFNNVLFTDNAMIK